MRTKLSLLFLAVVIALFCIDFGPRPDAQREVAIAILRHLNRQVMLRSKIDPSFQPGSTFNDLIQKLERDAKVDLDLICTSGTLFYREVKNGEIAAEIRFVYSCPKLSVIYFADGSDQRFDKDMIVAHSPE
ncbi:MAG: hypothetical protein IPK32_19595 [Verrucomicrobiaceae bacterium]|nr:hypothetical protein [Verrucomicrobiaceae bacterium]